MAPLGQAGGGGTGARGKLRSMRRERESDRYGFERRKAEESAVSLRAATQARAARQRRQGCRPGEAEPEVRERSDQRDPVAAVCR